MSTLLHESIERLVAACHIASRRSGWWTDKDGADMTDPEYMRKYNIVPLKLCLSHSELSEGLEGYRKNLNDDHLPHRKMIEVEIADAFIRLADLAGAMQLDLGGAIVEKLAYNAQRADHKPENRAKEGGKSF